MSPRIAYALMDGGGILVAARSPRTVFYPASTMKLAVALAAARLVDAGRLSWEQTEAWTTTFTGTDGTPYTFAADHVDEDGPEIGTPVTLRELVAVMISRSSNEATNLVMQLVPQAARDEALALAGNTDTRVERMISDASAGAAGLANETTALDLVRMMRTIVAGQFTSPESTALLVRSLRDQQLPAIGLVVPAGVPWGSKSGSIEHVQHDVAFVGDPSELVGSAGRRASDMRFLAIMTDGMEEAAAKAAIRALAAALLGY